MGRATIDLPEDLFPNDATSKQPTGLLKWAGATIDSQTGRATAKEKPKRRATMAASVFNRAVAETEAMMAEGDWSQCTARHIVALYDLMHMKVYGIESSMSSGDRHIAALRAGSFAKRELGGDFEKVVDYFRWVWTREMGREKWRRENGREGARLTIGWCFGGALFTDYRLALTRRAR